MLNYNSITPEGNQDCERLQYSNIFNIFKTKPERKTSLPVAQLLPEIHRVLAPFRDEDRKPGDFGLRGFYPADAKGQYDMQVRAMAGEV